MAFRVDMNLQRLSNTLITRRISMGYSPPSLNFPGKHQINYKSQHKFHLIGTSHQKNFTNFTSRVSKDKHFFSTSPMAEILVILDFDKTIIDVDSDYWLIDEFGLRDLFNQLLPKMTFNSVMSTLMNHLHAQGTTIQQIADVIKRIPVHPRIIQAIKTAYDFGCELRIVSDANTFFISTILEHIGLKDYFSEINTNPSFVDEQGRLNIVPHHYDHGCLGGFCPPNMCKGSVIERIQNSVLKKIIYAGDGAGDYCPSLKLRPADFFMPRKNFPVWDLVCQNPGMVKGEIREWIDGEEFERVLLQIVGAISLQENRDDPCCSSDDRKLPTLVLPTATLEALPIVLPVT